MKDLIIVSIIFIYYILLGGGLFIYSLDPIESIDYDINTSSEIGFDPTALNLSDTTPSANTGDTGDAFKGMLRIMFSFRTPIHSDFPVFISIIISAINWLALFLVIAVIWRNIVPGVGSG